MPDELWVTRLGVVPYPEATAIQEAVRARRLEREVPDVLLLLEHPPVYTLGRRTGPGDLGMGEAFYRDHGIDVADADRGGRVTYHGPGQLVGYPIMAIADVRRHVRAMEQALIAALDDEGVAARVRPDEGPEYTGVWVQDRKIASIGVHVHKGVTTHGFAVNLTNDLRPFGWVVACGLPDVQMTSLAAETSRTGDLLPCFSKRVAWRFAQATGRRQRLISPARAGIRVPEPVGAAR
jgi:lipoyl(octanoyl) transferase